VVTRIMPNANDSPPNAGDGSAILDSVEALTNLLFLIREDRTHPDRVLEYVKMADAPLNRLRKLGTVEG
jgi:hypothetical protein